MRTLTSILMLLAILHPAGAASQSPGFGAGLTHVAHDEWVLGYRLAGRLLRERVGRLQYGIEGGVELWRPSDSPPAIGVDWDASGSAWLFEAGPVVRVTTGRSESGGVRLFGQGGAGVTVVSSDAEIVSYPVVPDPPGSPLEIMGSQTAAYVQAGVGIGAPAGSISGELSVLGRAIFADPETMYSISFLFGVQF